MRYPKHSIDYEINLESFREMEMVVPMTKPERTALRRWVKKGHDLETNPWNSRDADGEFLNYLRAYRLEYGYSSGPWDTWKGPDTQWYWNPSTHSFSPEDEF